MLPIPGVLPAKAEAPIATPYTFTAEVATPNSIIYKGVRLQLFWTLECEEWVGIGDQIHCLFVPDTQQIMFLGRL